MRLWSRFRFSLSGDFNLFAAIIIATFTVLLLASYLMVQYRLKKEVYQDIESMAQRLEANFSKVVEYRTYLAEFIANKIARVENGRVETIAGLLDSNFRLDVALTLNHLFPWGVFTWIDRNGYAKVSNIEGILQTPRLIKQDALLKKTATYPGKMFFTEDTEPSGSVVQGFLGVNNSTGTYIGTLMVTINLEEVTSVTWKQSLDQTAFKYTIINIQNNSIVLSNASDIAVPNFLDSIKHLTDSAPLKNGDTTFIGTKTIGSLPYLLVFGSSSHNVGVMLYQRLLPYCLIYLGIMAGCLLLLFFFKRRMVSPFIELSKYADAINKEHTDSCVPRSTIYEAKNLSLKLLQLRRKVVQDKRRQIALDLAVRTARESSIALEEFQRRTNQELAAPIRLIKGYSGLLLKHYQQEGNYNITPEKLQLLLNEIYEAAEQIHTGVVNILNITAVNAVEVVQECVTSMQLKSLIVRSITITTHVHGNIPEFHTDELRFRQIVIALLSRAISCSKEKDKIHIEMDIEKENTLIIRITDSGLGLTEEEMARVESKYSSAMNRNFDGTDIGLTTVRKIVYLLKGDLQLDAQWRKGTVVSVRLPILSKKQLSLSSINSEEATDNVVVFPNLKKE